MRLQEVGEFYLIERFKKYFSSHNDKLIAGIGEDCAVVLQSAKKCLLLTCDMLVEDVHFSLKYFSPYQIGWKTLAVNISDIASCGGMPHYALISIGLKKDMQIRFVEEIVRGIKKLASIYGVYVVGGDTVLSDKLVINIALTGEVEKKYLTKRYGTKAGDIICVSGYLGESYAGFLILKDKSFPRKGFSSLVNAHLMPHPPVFHAQKLSQTKKISAMMDISDGLVGDLIKIAKINNVGFKIFKEKIPISSSLKKFAAMKGKCPYKIAMHGGEDYKLLFTIPSSDIEKIKKSLPWVIEIGEITRSGYILVEKKKEIPLQDTGYDHFLSERL